MELPFWHEYAACRGMETSDFYPQQGQNAVARRAREICAQCPVVQACLADALATPPHADWGIRGGTTESQREQMRRMALEEAG